MMKYQLLIIFGLLTSSALTKNLNHVGDSEDDDSLEIEFQRLPRNQNPENNGDKHKALKVCRTKECKILGEEFSKGMNTSVNPCDDFYEFVCGTWKTKYEIPENVPAWSRGIMYQRTVFRRIEEILKTVPKKSDILPIRQAKKWYQACINTDDLERRGIKPIESILMQSGGWPMIMDTKEWNENDHSWQKIEEHYFHLTSANIFLELTTDTWSGEDLRVADPELPLSSKLSSKYRNYTGNKYGEYVKLIENVSQIFIEHNKANVMKKTLKKDIRDLINFEKKLNQVNNGYGHDSRELWYHKYNAIDKFIEGYDEAIDTKFGAETVKINFRKIFENKFGLINMDVNNSIILSARGYEYYANLTELLNNTPKRTIVNYLHWHFVSKMLTYTTEKMRLQFFEYESHHLGDSRPTPRWLVCTLKTEMLVAEAYAFMKKYFPKDVEHIARKMIKNIQKEMKIQISSAKWMDKKTKNIATKKLKSMEISLGFPNWLKNETNILNFYKGLIIGYDHFNNILSINKFRMKQKWEEKFGGLHVERLDIRALVVYAHYSVMDNTIDLPGVDFQPPFFTPQLPSVINYGTIGTVIGHEMEHSFDIEGIQRDKDGNQIEISKKVMDTYYKQAECFDDQYGKDEITEANYGDTTPSEWERNEGKRRRAENMADSTGLHAVANAYRNARVKNPNNVGTLPGFENYTDDQMFFISYGILWCEKMTPEYEKMIEKFGRPGPPRLRINGAVSNSNDFSKAFKCSEESPMNPKKKCNVWKLKNHTGPTGFEKTQHSWMLTW